MQYTKHTHTQAHTQTHILQENTEGAGRKGGGAELEVTSSVKKTSTNALSQGGRRLTGALETKTYWRHILTNILRSGSNQG